MGQALIHGRVLIDGTFVEGVAVLIDGRRIESIVGSSEVPADAQHIDLGGGYLVPGFIDVQVNGGGDRLFNDDPTADTIARIGAAHRQFGTAGFLPTLISDDAAKIEAAMEAARSAIDAGVPGVLGVHIEGPFPKSVAERHSRRFQAPSDIGRRDRIAYEANRRESGRHARTRNGPDGSDRTTYCSRGHRLRRSHRRVG